MKNLFFAVLCMAIMTSCAEEKKHTLADYKKKHLDGSSDKKVGVPLTLTYDDEVLLLNGSGYRVKYFMKIYECGLYVPKKSSDANELIMSDSVIAVRLRIVSNLITRDNMTRVVRVGFVQSTKGNTENIQTQIDLLMENFNKAPVEIGNTYDMLYVPGKGLQGYLNEKPWGPIIECGPEFRHALIGIWLSDDPVDIDLKENMLSL